MAAVQRLSCDHEATLTTTPRAQSVPLRAVQTSHLLQFVEGPRAHEALRRFPAQICSSEPILSTFSRAMCVLGSLAVRPLAFSTIFVLQTRWLWDHPYLVHSTWGLIWGHGKVAAVASDLQGIGFDSWGHSTECPMASLLPPLGHHPPAGGSAQHCPPS